MSLIQEHNTPTPSPARYGLVGYPLGHSFSAQYFAEKFRREGINATYENFELPSIDQVRLWIKTQPGLQGFNVTIPYKQSVMHYLDDVSHNARSIGAVNVVRIVRDNHGEVRLIGDNSDIIGFTESLRPLLRPEMNRALVLGTGGASRAVILALLRLGIQPTYVSRHEHPEGIAVGPLIIPVITYAQLTAQTMYRHLLIINTTPLGMYPDVDSLPPIPYHALTLLHVLFDLVYTPEETRFMLEGKRIGATVKNGLEMLHAQAEAAWKMWQNDGLQP